MNKKKRFLIAGVLISIISLLTIVAFIDKTESWHSADEILITIGSYTMTLEEAISHEVFLYGATKSYTTEISKPGHNADEIWISVNGNEMNLEQAAVIKNLCGKDSPSSSYESDISLGQFANEIEISPGKSLQDAINIGDFCAYFWYTGPWGSCIDDPYDYNPNNCIQTRVVYCRRNDGLQVADSYCSGIKPSSVQSCTCTVW